MNKNNIKQTKLRHKLSRIFQKRRSPHDPWLALNMSVFNFESGWSRILNPIRQHE